MTTGSLVERAAAAFGIPSDLLEPLGGATGQVFGTDDVVLKVGYTLGVEREIAAGIAASAAVPVPAVLDRADFEEGSAFLTPRVAGTIAGDLSGLDAAAAHARGRTFGSLFGRLTSVTAPDILPVLAGQEGSRQLLHLDLHPFNVLMDERGEVIAVIDWTNAAAGPAELDRARTATILALDPTALQFAAHPLFPPFLAGIAESAGFDDLSSDALAWGCRFLLDDLGRRHTPDELAHARVAHELVASGDRGAILDRLAGG